MASTYSTKESTLEVQEEVLEKITAFILKQIDGVLALKGNLWNTLRTNISNGHLKMV